MSWYEDQVLPRFIDVALGGSQFAKLRGRVAGQLDGEVLEIGFGSGRNVPHYPSSVTRVFAVEPSEVGRTLASKRVEASPVPVEHVGLDGQALTLDDESVDCVLSTWTLCTIPQVDVALTEVRRVLRPGGRLYFLEHGRADRDHVVRWQDRLTPIQRRVAGGCHLNRPIDSLIRDADLDVTHVSNYYLKGPKPLGYMYEGVARKG